MTTIPYLLTYFSIVRSSLPAEVILMTLRNAAWNASNVSEWRKKTEQAFSFVSYYKTELGSTVVQFVNVISFLLLLALFCFCYYSVIFGLCLFHVHFPCCFPFYFWKISHSCSRFLVWCLLCWLFVAQWFVISFCGLIWFYYLNLWFDQARPARIKLMYWMLDVLNWCIECWMYGIVPTCVGR